VIQVPIKVSFLGPLIWSCCMRKSEIQPIITDWKNQKKAVKKRDHPLDSSPFRAFLIIVYLDYSL